MIPVRIGVIGAGAFGRKHIEIMQKEPSCVLAAIADPVSEAAAYAGQLGVPYFAEYSRRFEEEGLDGVIIATPNALHVPIGRACAARDMAILIEKPIGETVAAARGLTKAAEHAGIALLVGHHRRHNPIIEKAREIVQGGSIGRITGVVGLWLLRKPDD